MLRSSIYFILLLIPLVITCKSTSKKLVTSKVIYNIEDHIDSLLLIKYSPNSIENEKFNIRIDYKGNIHTVKSKMFLKYDSIIYINFSSTFSIPIATFYAFKNKIQLVDNPQRIVYEADYETLSAKLGFPVSFRIIQSVVDGTPYTLIRSNKLTNRKTENNSIWYNFNNKSTLYNLGFSFNPYTRKMEYFDIANEEHDINFLSTTYTYDNKYSQIYPQSVLLNFFLNNEPLEIELDFRDIVLNNYFSVPYDSTFIVLPLFPSND